MRACLVSVGDPTRDPRARALARSLHAAGHQVAAVGQGASGPFPVPVQAPRRPGRFRRLLTRQGEQHRLAAAAAEAGDLFVPIRRRDVAVAVDAAAASGGVVVGEPGWELPPSLDLARRAPAEPVLASSPAGRGAAHHQPGWDPPSPTPQPGRHRGLQVVVVGRHTDTTPARYLSAALERAGVTVHRTEELDWNLVPPEADGVVVVESPYPPPPVRGEPGDTPILFWVHHGEHHLAANLRLTRRYQPSGVLLAHSWHLAHRFPVPVHRFPFGVPPELFPPDPPLFSERRYDVAMVGAGTHHGGGRYDRRAALVAELEESLGDRAVFPRERLSPEEMADLYRQARIVPNEVGSRHRPITMRVFEAVGSGALLLTDPTPGTELLFTPGDHYEVLTEPFTAQIRGLLADPASADRASSAFRYAHGRHTTDHRVDELLAVFAADRGEPGPGWPPPEEGSLPWLIDHDLDVTRVLASGGDLEGAIPEVEVWPLDQARDRLRPGGFDAVAVVEVPDDPAAVVAAAKRYVYGTREALDPVRRALTDLDRPHRIDDHGSVFRVDLLCFDGYRMREREVGS